MLKDVYDNGILDHAKLTKMRNESNGYPALGDMRLMDDLWGHKESLRPVIVCGFFKNRTYVMTCTTTPDSITSKTYRLRDEIKTSKGLERIDSNVVLDMYVLNDNLSKNRLKGRLSDKDLTALLNYMCYSKTKL